MDSLAMRHLGEKTIAYEEVCGKGVHQITFARIKSLVLSLITHLTLPTTPYV